MKKINIVTYCTYKSLGSILQSYGLYKQLSTMGHEVSILLENKENLFSKTRIYSLKSFCKKAFEGLIINKLRKAHEKRVSFISEKIDILYLNGMSDFIVKAKESGDDIYISGSDQVWQPDNCNPIFFLDFVENKKCISYAASMGKTIISADKEVVFKKYLNNFKYISVREEECAEVIRNLTNREVEVHIDPTFLVSAEEWRALSIPYKVKKPYILLYMLYWDESCKKHIKELKKKTGLMVYAIADGLSRVYADKVLYDVGIEEFLWLVDHAEYVVTSSFHGTAFSVIFNKRFASIVNPKAPSRIENLLRKLDLPFVAIEELPTSNEFNYIKTNQLIKAEKAKSIEYLKRVIE